MDELADEMKATKQRLVGLEQNVRQPRLTMEADVSSNTKTRERTEGAAAAVQAIHGDSCSSKRVEAGPTCSTSCVKAEPLTLACRDDVLVENGAAAPKSCLSTLEMRTPTAADGVLPVGTASTATRTTFDQPPLWFCPTEEINSRTSNVSKKRNLYKLWYSIQAVLQVVSTPARC